MGILKKYLYLLLPLFLIGNLARVEVRDGVFVNPLDVGMLLGAPFVIYYMTLYQEKVRQHPLSRYISVFLASLLLSLLVNIFVLTPNDLLIASLYFVRLFVYAQVIFIFSLLDTQFCRKYLKLLFFTIALSSAMGLAQYILYPNLRNLEYLGWDVHQYRVFGSFLDPNFAGVIFALGIAIGVSVVPKFSKNEKIMSCIGNTAMLVSLFLTYSRTALLSFVIAAVVYLAREVRKIYILLFLILFAVGVVLLPHNLKSEGVNLMRTASITARAKELQEGIVVFADHPLFGVGYNAYRAYNPRAQNNLPENAASGIPNSYIFTLATGGIVGFAALAYVLYGVYRLVTATKEKHLKTLVVTTSTVLAASALFENTLYYTYILLIYFSILGIVTRLRGSTSR